MIVVFGILSRLRTKAAEDLGNSLAPLAGWRAGRRGFANNRLAQLSLVGGRRFADLLKNLCNAFSCLIQLWHSGLKNFPDSL